MTGDPQTTSGLVEPLQNTVPNLWLEAALPCEKGWGVRSEAGDTHGTCRACQHASYPTLLQWHRAPSSGKSSLQSKVTSRFSSCPFHFVPFLEQQPHCFSPGGVDSDPTCSSSLWELSCLAYQLQEEGRSKPVVIPRVVLCLSCPHSQLLVAQLSLTL